jgi:ParB family chromosome partitioning protein
VVPTPPPTAAAAGSTPPVAASTTPAAHGPSAAPRLTDGSAVLQLLLDHIDSNPYQTRSRIPQEELQELCESIQANGVIQPIVVRPGKDGRYVLITGDRRTRASRLAGKDRIPAIVRHVSDQQAAEMTIVENLQRQDLNCWDQAQAFARLSRDFGLTQEQIGKRTGCDRSSVSNYMRLLKLPAEVQTMLQDGQLDFSQARVLLTVQNPDQVFKVARQALGKHLSVIQLEALVAHTNFPAEGQAQPGVSQPVDPNVKAAQRELETILGVRVSIRDRRGKGKIVIEYSSLDDFDRVLEMLKGKNH